MMTFNISPDTLVAEKDVPEELVKYYDKLHINDFLQNGIPNELKLALEKYKLTMTLNGMFYRTDKQGFIGGIVSDVFKQRKIEKGLMLGYEDQLEKAENELKVCTDPDRKRVLEESIFNLDTFVNIHHNTQLALKTLMNALYGAMGQPNFRHFDFYNAEAITSSGQFAIQYNTKAVNKYVEKLCGDPASAIYNDTDSISISLQGVIDKMKVNRDNPAYIDALCKFADTNLNKQTAVACQEIADGLNVFENKLSFKREKVFLSGLYIAKKRYALLVIDEEGVRFGEPKVKVTGLEIKRSDTPFVCREAMKEALSIILTKTEPELQRYVSEFEKKFQTFNPEQIALPTGVKGFSKYSLVDSKFTSGTPIHVKAALIYNEMIKRLNLSNDHQMIMEGGKMRYVKLKVPNPTSKEVCGFIGKIPKEFDLDKYVDYDKMFEDTFAKGTRRMVEAAGWNMKYTESVEDWFD